MLGKDIAVLLKLFLLEGPRILSKTLADELFLPPGEVSKSLNRCKESGLLYWSDLEKRVNRSALLDFLAYGLRHVFPPKRGALVRGVPTAAAAEPLKSHFLDDGNHRRSGLIRKAPSAAYRSLPCIKVRRKPHCSIPGFTNFWLYAMPFAVEEPGNGYSRLSCCARHSMPDPNLRLLEEAATKLAPFLREIVFKAPSGPNVSA